MSDYYIMHLIIIADLSSDLSGPGAPKLTVACNDNDDNLRGHTFRAWIHSADGFIGDINNELLNTTATSRYAVNGDTLTVNNIRESDEGLYSCIYGDQDSPVLRNHTCLFVYGEL